MTFTAGEPAEVVVALTDSSVVVSEFAGVWESPFTLAARPRRVGVLKWRRLPETPLFNALTALIKGARDAPHSRFQTCRYCGHPPAAGGERQERNLPTVAHPPIGRHHTNTP